MRNRFTSIEASRQSIENKLSHLQAKIKKRQNQPFNQTLPLQDIDLLTNPKENSNYVQALNLNSRNEKLTKSINERLIDIKSRTLSSNPGNMFKVLQKSPLKKSKQLANSIIHGNHNNQTKENIAASNQKIKRQNLRQSAAINHINENSHNNNPKQMNQTELYDMIKTIMLGQQQIQKQLSQIKLDLSVQPSVRKSFTVQRQPSHQHQKLSETLNLREKFQKNQKDQLNQKSKTVGISNQQQVRNQICQEDQEVSDRSKNQVQQKLPKKTKRNNYLNKQSFEKLVHQAKHKKPERFKISSQSQILTSLWDEISKKIKASNLQYKQTSHLNNRHVNDHLMNTIQLQRKTKENLVNKVYSQCNNCVYK